MVAALADRAARVDGHDRRRCSAWATTDRPRRSRSTTPSGARRSGPARFYGSCDHERMLALGEGPGAVHPPLPHDRRGDRRARSAPAPTCRSSGSAQLVTDAGQPFEYVRPPGRCRTRSTAPIRSSTSTPWSAGPARCRRSHVRDHDDGHPHRHRRAAPVAGASRARRPRPPRRDGPPVRRRPGHGAAARRGRRHGPRARRRVRHPRAQRPPRRPGRPGDDPVDPGHAAPGRPAADRGGRRRCRRGSRAGCSTRYADDIAVRVEHVQDRAARARHPTVRAAERRRSRSGASDDGSVTVEAVGVHHEPVREAVAYRITTPAGVVVISGDTRVCDEVRDLAAGADVLVHEACRASAHGAARSRERRSSRSSTTTPTRSRSGGMAEAAGVGHLVLTHLIPPPTDPAAEQAFADDVREGGYTGRSPSATTSSPSSSTADREASGSEAPAGAPGRPTRPSADPTGIGSSPPPPTCSPSGPSTARRHGRSRRGPAWPSRCSTTTTGPRTSCGAPRWTRSSSR